MLKPWVLAYYQDKKNPDFYFLYGRVITPSILLRTTFKVIMFYAKDLGRAFRILRAIFKCQLFHIYKMGVTWPLFFLYFILRFIVTLEV